MANIFTAAFIQRQGLPADTDKAKRQSDRNLVALHSNGNIRLQLGKYATKSDLDKQYGRVAAYNFQD